VRFHLQLFARPVVELFGKETVRAPHIAYARNQYVQKYRRDRLSDDQSGVSFKYLFCRKIHRKFLLVLNRLAFDAEGHTNVLIYLIIGT
jgi:hypothetical protein